MKKRAQGISMETIIIAIIVLLVLVIIAAVFAGSIGKWGVQKEDCSNRGGACADSCQSGTFEIVGKCPSTTQKCCSIKPVSG